MVSFSQPTMDCIFNQFSDCTFQDSYGSALAVVDSHVVLRGNNSFVNNCRLCSNKRCGGHNYQGPRCYGGGVSLYKRVMSVSLAEAVSVVIRLEKVEE